MTIRAPLVLLSGAIPGGVAGWLAFSWSVVRDDVAQGVGMVLIGAVYGAYIAVLIVTKGTCDFRPQPPGGIGSDVGQL
jgi:hypothetical protein